MKRDWIARIEKGDVLRAKSGLLRIVRYVSHSGAKTHVCFSIKRCSWTNRCYTVYNANDLRTFGFQPTGKRVSLRRQIDRKVAVAIHTTKRKGMLTCCDVKGIS